MKRYVVVSTNNNPDYMFYAPYIEKAWNALGWTLCIMVTPGVSKAALKLNNDDTLIFDLPDIYGLRKESIAQAGRLYAANHLPAESLIMTSDIDLLPLSDYWKHQVDHIAVYGHDLTDFTFYPMGYIAMRGYHWRSYMKLNGDTKADMIRDAEQYKHLAYASDWQSWWNWDWTMITERLKPHANGINFITRGRRSSGIFAYGRVDRGDSMQIPAGETLIDAHCENVNVQHPDKLNKFLTLFESHYGKL